MFCRRFFELAPETRSLFPNDLERQYLTLMDMMAAIIGALDRQELPVNHHLCGPAARLQGPD